MQNSKWLPKKTHPRINKVSYLYSLCESLLWGTQMKNTKQKMSPDRRTRRLGSVKPEKSALLFNLRIQPFLLAPTSSSWRNVPGGEELGETAVFTGYLLLFWLLYTGFIQIPNFLKKSWIFQTLKMSGRMVKTLEFVFFSFKATTSA